MNSEDPKILSDHERDSFRGQTIDELALGFIVFCIVAVIIGALGFIIMAMPYLLGIFVIYCIYSIVSSLLHR